MEKVILASQNEGKIREIGEILSGFGMETISRDAAGLPAYEVEETGTTCEENSYIKAKAIFDMTGVTTIADDSGLEVDALDGAPGVYSARFAGDGCTPHDNNVKLLRLLDGIPSEKRTARFVSVLTMLFPDGSRLVARGECSGRVADKLSGTEGFGYDPLFVPDGYDITFAEMGSEEKNRISHRARSLHRLEELICDKKEKNDPGQSE